MNKTIVGFGELLWDCLPQGKEIGGAPGNFVFHAGQCGLNSVLVSAVGTDTSGTELLAEANARGLQLAVTRVSHPTGTAQISLDSNGVPQYDICSDVAWDYIPFTPDLAELARKADGVYFGSLSQRSETTRASLRFFLSLMKPTAFRLFDINLRAPHYTPQVIIDSLQVCNFLKLNEEELHYLSQLIPLDPARPEAACRQLIRTYGLCLVVLTCGASRSYAITSDKVSILPTPRVDVADTVGAGDAFSAALCAAMIKGKPLVEAHRLAVDVSAYVCTHHGAMHALPQALRSQF